MGDDINNIDNDENLGGEDNGTIQGGAENPVNPPSPDNDPIIPPADPEPDPAPADDESSDGDEEFLKYVKMANDLCWVPGILKAYGADKQMKFGKVEEEEYVEDEETNKLIWPNEYDDYNFEPDDQVEEPELYGVEEKQPVLDDANLDPEAIFNNEPEIEFEKDDNTLEEEVFPQEYDDNNFEPDDEVEEPEVFSLEKCAEDSAADEESPLNGEDEELEEDTFNYPQNEEDTITPWYTRETGEETEGEDDSEKIRDMLMKLLPSEDAEGAIQDPEWTFGKFMKEKFPSYVASDRAAKFLDLVAQYSVVDAVERLAAQEAKEEVLAAATGDEDQDELLALVQESAEAKRKQYLADYVLPDAEGEPAKYRKFWKDVLDIIKAL